MRVLSFPHCTMSRRNWRMKWVCWDTSPSLPARKANMVNRLFNAVISGSLRTTDFCPLLEPCVCGLCELNMGTLSPVSFSRRSLLDTPSASKSSVSRSRRTRLRLFPRYGFELLYSKIENMQYTHNFARMDDCGSTSSSLLCETKFIYNKRPL